VSVVVPVYNGERTIERCLESVTAQRVSFPFEIVVADSSKDRTPEIIAERFPGVRLIRLGERAYPGTARNAAIREARAPLVALVDADCIAAPDWLARLVAAHEAGEYAAVGGAICNGTPGSWSGLIGYLLEFREFIPRSPRREVITIPTANICYRRELFERYGLFEDVRASEDLLFNWQLSLSGERILFDPKISVTHLNRTGWRKVLTYQNVLGTNSALARHRMNPPFEVVRAYPALGWLMPYLIRYPSLGILIPPVRLARALLWLARYDLRTFAALVLLSPGYLLGAFLWSTSFVRALREKKLAETRDVRLAAADERR
jgi:glycosyltransferase involved in cell wall biosynthesis